MWYISVSHLLKVKIKEPEQVRFPPFIIAMFKCVEESLNINFKDEPGVLLGVVQKLWTSFAQAENGSVPLQDFARQLLGLILVFSKLHDDLAIFNAEFRYLFIDKNDLIKAALNLDEEVLSYKQRLEKKELGFQKAKSTEGYYSLMEQARMLVLKELEIETLQRLQYCLDVDLQALGNLIKATQSPVAVAAFLVSAEALREKSEPFDDLIKSLDQIFYDYQQEGKLSELLNKVFFNLQQERQKKELQKREAQEALRKKICLPMVEGAQAIAAAPCTETPQTVAETSPAPVSADLIQTRNRFFLAPQESSETNQHQEVKLSNNDVTTENRYERYSLFMKEIEETIAKYQAKREAKRIRKAQYLYPSNFS